MPEHAIGYWDPASAIASSANLAFDNPGGTFHQLGSPEAYLRGRWEQRNRLNVPGPFYCGETDTFASPSASTISKAAVFCPCRRSMLTELTSATG